jgi:hypothetical protein
MTKPKPPQIVANRGRIEEESLLAFLVQGEKLAVNESRFLVAALAEIMRPYGIPPTLFHEALHEAAKKAGWAPPSELVQRRQKLAARARKNQREQDLALRQVLVAYLFQRLPQRLQAKPSSTGTAQAIIGRLEKLPFSRTPPMTVRTIQADIKSMNENGNFLNFQSDMMGKKITRPSALFPI